MSVEPRRRVTVIDHSPELLALFGEVLRGAGWDVSLLDGEGTLDDAAASGPDLLVMELRLGGAGLDDIRVARSHPALGEVPIIVCSTANDDLHQHEQELSETPLLFVLPKPFSLDDLEACVARALGESRGLAAAG